MILIKLIPFYLVFMLGMYITFGRKQSSKWDLPIIFGWVAMFMVTLYFTFTL